MKDKELIEKIIQLQDKFANDYWELFGQEGDREVAVCKAETDYINKSRLDIAKRIIKLIKK